MSIWVDVDFDHAAAARAADACRRTAAGLDVAAAGAHTVAGEVIDGWEGRARAGFDPAVRATTSVMVETAAACLALAADIEAASAAATAEQRRREDAREAEREERRREAERRRDRARAGHQVPR